MMKIEIYMQDTSKVVAHVEHYNAEELNRKINEKQNATIVIGDVIVDPRNVMRIVPIRE